MKQHAHFLDAGPTPLRDGKGPVSLEPQASPHHSPFNADSPAGNSGDSCVKPIGSAHGSLPAYNCRHSHAQAPCWQAGAPPIVSPDHSSGFCRHSSGLAPAHPVSREGAAISVLSSRGAILSSPSPFHAKVSQLSIVQFYRDLLSSKSQPPFNRLAMPSITRATILEQREASATVPPRRAKHQRALAAAITRSTFPSPFTAPTPFFAAGSAIVRTLSQRPMQ